MSLFARDKVSHFAKHKVSEKWLLYISLSQHVGYHYHLSPQMLMRISLCVFSFVFLGGWGVRVMCHVWEAYKKVRLCIFRTDRE